MSDDLETSPTIHEIVPWSPNERNEGGFVVRWSKKRIGFGELTFKVDKYGKFHCDNEYMSREFVQDVLVELAKTVILKDGPDTNPSELMCGESRDPYRTEFINRDGNNV